MLIDLPIICLYYRYIRRCNVDRLRLSTEATAIGMLSSMGGESIVVRCADNAPHEFWRMICVVLMVLWLVLMICAKSDCNL